MHKSLHVNNYSKLCHVCGKNTRMVHIKSTVSIEVLHCRVSVTNITGLFDCRVLYLNDISGFNYRAAQGNFNTGNCAF